MMKDSNNPRKTINKITYVLLSAVIVSTFLNGCSSSPSSPAASSQPTAAATATPKPTATATPSGKPGSGKLGNYTIEFTGYKVSKDYNGKPAVIVSYNWTNNSQKATSAAVAFMIKVFQNGIECSTAIIMDDKNYNGENYMKDIQPGISLPVQQAFVLQDITNKIDVQAQELISLSDATVKISYDITK